ncbi:MAG: DNRLRE domain-containing protein [Chthoniobacter sp.]|nr:DNRLRE domain-containing protein [Chthoniobacter sp.]
MLAVASALPIRAATLILQNGVNGYDGTEDTVLDSYEPATNYGGFLALWLGAARNPEIMRDLIRFDVGALSGAYTQIDSITLRLYATGVVGSGTAQLHAVSEANGDWVEGSAFATQQNGTSVWMGKNSPNSDWTGGRGLGEAGSGYGPALATQEFSSTSLGQFDLAITDPTIATTIIDSFLLGANEGFLLRTAIENPNSPAYINFSSSDSGQTDHNPTLIVIYTPTPEPSASVLAIIGAAVIAGVRRRTTICYERQATSDPVLLSS